MRAIIVSEPGGVDALQVGEAPDPTPQPGEALVRVRAAGVNRADLLQRQGHYPPPPGVTDIIGLECSGVVESVPVEAAPWAAGDEVAALLAGGGYAELVAVPVGQLAPVPPGVSLVDAAGVMEVAATVWSNVVMTAGLKPGQRLLVHGGSSGIGTMAIQIATALGAEVVVTVGTDDKASFCRDLGAAQTINYREQEFADVLAGSVDVVLDTIGAKYLPGNLKALRRGGRVVTIGLQGGVKGELNLGALLAKNASVTATSLRMRPVSEKSEIVAELIEHVWPMFADGRVRPIVHETLPLAEVRRAHQTLDESTHIGKILLTL